MKLSIILFISLVVFSCKTNKGSNSSENEQLSYLSYQDYTPNPDEVVVSAKLISFDSGIVKAEVVQQLKIGFSAKIVLSGGDMLTLLSDKKPDGEMFICAFEVREALGNKSQYRISRFLK